MQTSLNYRTNRDLFSNYYLNEHFPETEVWDEINDDDLREKRAEIVDLWERERDTVAERTESSLEEKFIRPLFRILGIPFEVEETVQRGQRRPDYGFFPSEDEARNAFNRKKEGGDFYENAIAVADAKRWGRPLDTRGSGEHKRDFENPSYQIHVYLQETPAQWAVLTDGKKWRLYYGPTSHRLDSYYEVDLPTVLEKGDLDDFKYFYLFFCHSAFIEDTGGDCFLDDVYNESNVFAQELGADLQDNIYEAIKVLSEGYLQYPDNDLDEDDLSLVHDSSLIYLYRLIFVLYAEAEGRDLLNTDNEIYEESYSLNALKQEIADELDSSNPKYRDWQDNLSSRLNELFELIDQGSKSRGIPKEDLYIPAYNGGLFRTNPNESDDPEARFLAEHTIGDAYLARVVELLTRSKQVDGGGKIFVDYSSLDVRHLGSIYEGLLEYQVNVADGPLTVTDKEYVEAKEGDDVVVEAGEVYLTTGSGERKATGSYYTPEYVVEYIVDETLGPLIDDIRENLVGQSAFNEGGFAEEFADQVFDLKVLDPAMGSGHFLTSAVDYLAREIIDAQERQAEQQGIETIDKDRDINWARRQVAQRCIYGVDLNPLATELAKVSLWLRTLAAEQPLAFLDHHLKTGNSLVGSDIEDIEELDSEGGGDEQNASLADFGVARKGTIEQLMRIYKDFIAIENKELADVKEMESKYDEFERNKLRQRLEAMVNVHTADDFGLNTISEDDYEKMAVALDDDEKWKSIESSQWFQDAQQWAGEKKYFHWRLEYPEAFYNENGVKKDNPGFDAVLGNPPYVIFKTIDDDLRDYYDSKYDSFVMKGDIYILFMELASEMLKSQGNTGYIVQNKFTKANYGEKIRGAISEDETIRQIVNFNDSPVFDITAYPLILIRENSSPIENHTFEWKEIREENSTQIEKALQASESTWVIKQEDLSEGIWHQFVSEEGLSADTILLGEFAEQIGEGVASGLRNVYTVDKETIEEEKLEEEFVKPVLRGGDVSKYSINKSDLSFLIYPYAISNGKHRLVGESEIPNIINYLRDYEDELRERRNFGSTLIEQGYEWYEFKHAPEGVSKPKILFPDISPENRFAYDGRGDLFCLNTVYYLTRNKNLEKYDSRYLISILNSNFSDYLFKSMSPKVRGGYQRYKTQYVEQLPIPSIDFYTSTADRSNRVSTLLDDYENYLYGNGPKPLPEENDIAHDFLTQLSERMDQLKQERTAINLSLLDYLGISTEGLSDSMKGETLGEKYMPISGAADSPLAKTSEDLDGLRIENVSFANKGAKLVMSVDLSYKPTDEDSRETDSYGRLTEEEFETYEAMVFTGLTDIEETLVQRFVPVAVDLAGGFAGFRQAATTNNSLYDRLEDLTLPNITKIRNGLEKYVSRKNEADELDEQIEKTDDLIDHIVYNLFQLSEEEKEIVEEAVQDD